MTKPSPRECTVQTSLLCPAMSRTGRGHRRARSRRLAVGDRRCPLPRARGSCGADPNGNGARAPEACGRRVAALGRGRASIVIAPQLACRRAHVTRKSIQVGTQPAPSRPGCARRHRRCTGPAQPALDSPQPRSCPCTARTPRRPKPSRRPAGHPPRRAAPHRPSEPALFEGSRRRAGRGARRGPSGSRSSPTGRGAWQLSSSTPALSATARRLPSDD
jgi:hypothetical protein